jgi:general secretion pathway protein L
MGRILREMTEIMPDGAWLDSLQVQERKIIVAGNAPSATFMLEQMEISPLFQDARFDAPVTRQGALEVFRIAAGISAQ